MALRLLRRDSEAVEEPAVEDLVEAYKQLRGAGRSADWQELVREAERVSSQLQQDGEEQEQQQQQQHLGTAWAALNGLSGAVSAGLSHCATATASAPRLTTALCEAVSEAISLAWIPGAHRSSSGNILGMGGRIGA